MLANAKGFSTHDAYVSEESWRDGSLTWVGWVGAPSLSPALNKAVRESIIGCAARTYGELGVSDVRARGAGGRRRQKLIQRLYPSIG